MMNKLVMNYLVTEGFKVTELFLLHCITDADADADADAAVADVSKCVNRTQQRGSRKRQVWPQDKTLPSSTTGSRSGTTFRLVELHSRLCHRLFSNIQAGRVQESIALVNEQHPALLDSDRYLLFHLQQQQLIELIREQVFQPTQI